MYDRPIRRVFATAVPRSSGGWLLALVSVLLIIAGLVGVVAHYRSPGRSWVLGISAFAPYLMLAAPLALLLLIAGRLWLPAITSLVLTVVCIATQLPLYVAAKTPADAVSLTVMTSNLRLGMADPEAVVDAARRHHVDVLMLQELTPQEQSRLVAAGLNQVLPHHISDPRVAAEGTGLWSRFPLDDAQKRTDFMFAFVTARVEVGGSAAQEVTLAAAHMAGPYPVAFGWHIDIAHLAQFLPSFGEAKTAILGGDLNSTLDVKQFRALLTHGWADGAAQAGDGYTRTYPSDRSFPPLIAIDHVLTHGAVATSARTVEIPGSDHRALLVQVAVPTS